MIHGEPVNRSVPDKKFNLWMAGGLKGISRV